MTATTEALRLELAPFGVTVLTVNTGAVRTNGLANGVNFKLPLTSRYKSIEKEIAARARGEDGTPRMEPSVYAAKVVGDVLRGCRGQVWRGSYASVVRWVLSRLPSSMAVSRAQRSYNGGPSTNTVARIGSSYRKAGWTSCSKISSLRQVDQEASGHNRESKIPYINTLRK